MKCAVLVFALFIKVCSSFNAHNVMMEVLERRMEKLQDKIRFQQNNIIIGSLENDLAEINKTMREASLLVAENNELLSQLLPPVPVEPPHATAPPLPSDSGLLIEGVDISDPVLTKPMRNFLIDPVYIKSNITEFPPLMIQIRGKYILPENLVIGVGSSNPPELRTSDEDLAYSLHIRWNGKHKHDRSPQYQRNLVNYHKISGEFHSVHTKPDVWPFKTGEDFQIDIYFVDDVFTTVINKELEETPVELVMESRPRNIQNVFLTIKSDLPLVPAVIHSVSAQAFVSAGNQPITNTDLIIRDLLSKGYSEALNMRNPELSNDLDHYLLQPLHIIRDAATFPKEMTIIIKGEFIEEEDFIIRIGTTKIYGTCYSSDDLFYGLDFQWRSIASGSQEEPYHQFHRSMSLYSRRSGHTTYVSTGINEESIFRVGEPFTIVIKAEHGEFITTINTEGKQHEFKMHSEAHRAADIYLGLASKTSSVPVRISRLAVLYKQ